MINNKLLLCVDHKIFLNDEELNYLKKNNYLETQGFNVPVWLNIVSGKTSEPGEEIFCKYIICNDSDESFIGINREKVYEIFLPQKKKWRAPDAIDFEKLKDLSYEQRLIEEEKRKIWWNKNPKPPCLELLLESNFLNFEVRKIETFKNIKMIIKHDVQIGLISNFKDSIVT